MGYNTGKNRGKVSVLSKKTLEELEIEFIKLNPESHQKVYVQCDQCKEIFLRERRKLHQFHHCPVHILQENLKLKWCNQCKNFLKHSHFYANKRTADNLNSWCISCSTLFKYWAKNYLDYLHQHCRSLSLDCDLTIEDLKEIFASQNGRCYYSKVKLNFDVADASCLSKLITLDRIDLNKGYVVNNVVLCSNFKRSYGSEELTQFYQDMVLTNTRLEYQKTHPAARPPFRKRTTDAGYDLASVTETIISPGAVVNIETGLKISAPEGWYLTIDGRSSLFKEGIVPFRGIIDSNYTGPLLISLYNSSKKDFKVNIGDRIAQITLHKIYNVDFVEVQEFSPDYFVHRGEAGWGSSGRQ